MEWNDVGVQEDLRDANVGDCCAAAKEDGPDIVDHYGLDSPVRVEDGQGAQDGVGDGGRVEEWKDHCRHLEVGLFNLVGGHYFQIYMQQINGVEMIICTIDSSYDELTCAAETTFSAVHILTWSPELRKV